MTDTGRVLRRQQKEKEKEREEQEEVEILEAEEEEEEDVDDDEDVDEDQESSNGNYLRSNRCDRCLASRKYCSSTTPPCSRCRFRNKICHFSQIQEKVDLHPVGYIHSSYPTQFNNPETYHLPKLKYPPDPFRDNYRSFKHILHPIQEPHDLYPPRNIILSDIYQRMAYLGLSTYSWLTQGLPGRPVQAGSIVLHRPHISHQIEQNRLSEDPTSSSKINIISLFFFYYLFFL